MHHKNSSMAIPPIYIINLKRTPERRLYMQRQLDAFGLNYQFVDAIDKYDLPFPEYRTMIANQLNISKAKIENLFMCCLTRALACTLSHLKVFNLMMQNKVSRACVLEDDGYLLDDFPKILATSQKTNGDILLLSHAAKYKLSSSPSLPRKYHLNHKMGAIPDEKSSQYQVTSNHSIAKPYLAKEKYKIISAMGYMLTLEAAIKWRQTALSTKKNIDNIPFHLYRKGEVSLRILTPPCILINWHYIRYSAKVKGRIPKNQYISGCLTLGLYALTRALSDALY